MSVINVDASMYACADVRTDVRETKHFAFANLLQVVGLETNNYDASQVMQDIVHTHYQPQ